MKISTTVLGGGKQKILHNFTKVAKKSKRNLSKNRCSFKIMIIGIKTEQKSLGVVVVSNSQQEKLKL